MPSTQLVFPGLEPETLSAPTQAALSKAVRDRLSAHRRDRLQELREAVDAARDAYYGADARITYRSGKTSEEVAEDDRNRRKLRGLQSAWGDRKADLERWQVAVKSLFSWSAPLTPAQARRAVRAPRRAPQPVAQAYAPGSWVRWNDPLDGRLRFGVVTSAGHREVAGETTAWSTKNGRYVVPDDGGDAVVMGPGFARTVAEGRWEVYGRRPDHPGFDSYTGSMVFPALAQDRLL